MPDRYNLEIRRIRETDKDALFYSGHQAFDQCNLSGTLKEYWESDVQCEGGTYLVFILIETKSTKPIGLIRVRDELSGADPKIPEFNGKPAIYLSRLGLVPEKHDYHLGRVLLEYFFYIAKSKLREHSLDSVIAYLKCPDEKERIEYYESFGARIIREIYEEKWGKGLVMSTTLFFDDLKNERKLIRHQNHKSDISK